VSAFGAVARLSIGPSTRLLPRFSPKPGQFIEAIVAPEFEPAAVQVLDHEA